MISVACRKGSTGSATCSNAFGPIRDAFRPREETRTLYCLAAGSDVLRPSQDCSANSVQAIADSSPSCAGLRMSLSYPTHPCT